MQLPLFPLPTVLYPRGVLPLKVFEQRYLKMAKACLKDERPFGVCLLVRGDEVIRDGAPSTLEFASIGTTATISDWDMPQQGILHLHTVGGSRFQVRSHATGDDGLVTGEVRVIADEPALALPDAHRPLAALLERISSQVGGRLFAEPRAFGDASWVGY